MCSCRVDVLQTPFGYLILAISKGLQQETDSWFANVLKKCANRETLGVLLEDLIKFTKISHTTSFHCETAFLRFLKESLVSFKDGNFDPVLIRLGMENTFSMKFAS